MTETKAHSGTRGVVLIALVAPLLLAACAGSSDRHTQLDWTLSNNRPANGGFDIRVHDGDTLSEIAYRYDVSQSAIARANGISDHDSIYAGETLRIPYGHGTYHAEPSQSYASNDRSYASNDRTITPTPKPRDLAWNNTPKPSSSSRSHPWYNPQPSQQPASSNNDDVQQASYVPGSTRFQWPVSGRVISDFGAAQGGETNDGINIAAHAGDPIHAAASGTVTYAGNQLRGYGNLLLVKHEDGYITAYAHAQNLIVQKGDHVLKGQVIGYVGQTGDVTTPQLHFEIRRGVQPVNPKPLLLASR